MLCFSSSSSKAGILLQATTIVIVVPLGALALQTVLQNIRRRRTKRYPPGPPPSSWLFGHSLDFPDPSLGQIAETKTLEWAKQDKYGLFYSIHFPVIGRMIVVCDPVLARRLMLRKHDVFPKDFSYSFFHPVTGPHSMLVTNGDAWMTWRRIFTPAFSSKFLQHSVSIVLDKLERFIEFIELDIKNHRSTETLLRAQNFTADVIAAVVFGEDWGQEAVPHWFLIQKEIFRRLAAVDTDPWMLWLGPIYTAWVLRPLAQQVDDVMLKFVERRIQERQYEWPTGETLEKMDDDDDACLDICSRALRAAAQNNVISEQDKLAIAHQLKTFHFAGHVSKSIELGVSVWVCIGMCLPITSVPFLRRTRKIRHSLW